MLNIKRAKLGMFFLFISPIFVLFQLPNYLLISYLIAIAFFIIGGFFLVQAMSS